MTKILCYIVCILAVGMAILFFMYNYAENKIHALESQKNELSRNSEQLKKEIKDLENGIEEWIKKDREATDTIRKIRNSMVYNKVDSCDCYNTKLPDGMLNTIRERNKNKN